MIKRILLTLVAAAAAIYIGDYIFARVRGSGAMASVQVQPYYAVPLKDGKTEFMMLDPEMQTCVKALFPHFGYDPCWYLDGRKQQRIQM